MYVCMYVCTMVREKAKAMHCALRNSNCIMLIKGNNSRMLNNIAFKPLEGVRSKISLNIRKNQTETNSANRTERFSSFWFCACNFHFNSKKMKMWLHWTMQERMRVPSFSLDWTKWRLSIMISVSSGAEYCCNIFLLLNWNTKRLTRKRENSN